MVQNYSTKHNIHHIFLRSSVSIEISCGMYKRRNVKFVDIILYIYSAIQRFNVQCNIIFFLKRILMSGTVFQILCT